MFKKCHCCEAKLSDNRLVLSLPDALTPVMWMMDLSNEGTFVMRVEQDDNGLYVLQKLSVDGKKIEDIACYAEKNGAVNAMAMISKTIQTQKTNALSSRLSMLLSLLRIIILYGIGLCALIILTLFVYRPVQIIFGNIFGSETIATETVDESAAIMNNSSAPTVSRDPNAAGVPMSADDFLNNSVR